MSNYMSRLAENIIYESLMTSQKFPSTTNQIPQMQT